jgi:hypothetical protein
LKLVGVKMDNGNLTLDGRCKDSPVSSGEDDLASGSEILVAVDLRVVSSDDPFDLEDEKRRKEGQNDSL